MSRSDNACPKMCAIVIIKRFDNVSFLHGTWLCFQFKGLKGDPTLNTEFAQVLPNFGLKLEPCSGNSGSEMKSGDKSE